MSTHKGGARYTEVVDDVASDAKTDDSGDDGAAHGNSAWRHRRFNWLDSNYDALAESYAEFRSVGETFFGYSFFQLGSFQAYCNFIYKHTIPGPAFGSYNSNGHRVRQP